VQIRIEGTDLPGRGPGAEASALRLRQVHVGVQRKAEVVELFPADAESVRWDLSVSSREVDGLLDVGGPWVHGRPGARFLYLSWGSAGDGTPFAMFRRAKLLFGDIPTALLAAAHAGDGVLVGRLGLTDPDGGPRSARVRPPDIAWTLAAAS
jgi:hypothetical protein